MQSNEAIAERLRLVRDVVGMAQGEFAERAGIAANTYNQFERGRKRPSIENAIALCDTYNLTLDWIFRGDHTGLPFRMVDAIHAVRKARG